jgi:predicted O-methyltransferase YrrM
MNINRAIVPLIEELDFLRTRSDAWQIPRVEGEMLHQLALSIGAKKIVEVGTSYGFSGLFWGAALSRTGGVLHTIDADARKFKMLSEVFQKAGLRDIIVSHHGDARFVLEAIEGPIDIAFIDADKFSTQTYFDLLWQKIRPGGMVLTDNATTHREQLAEFCKIVRSRVDAVSTEIPVGNGIEWTVKIGP